MEKQHDLLRKQVENSQTLSALADNDDNNNNDDDKSRQLSYATRFVFFLHFD